MPLININADFKLLNKTLDRIARALERLLLEAYAVRLGHCAEALPDPNPKNEGGVAYATDEDWARRKLEDLALIAKDGGESDIEQDLD
jgi:hypothetical protein